MPGKWQILNGVKYPTEGVEEYNPHEDPAFQQRIANLLADMRGSKKGGTLNDNLYPGHSYNLRGKERVSIVPRDMRTRVGTDYRKLVAQREAAVIIQRHVRGFLSRLQNVCTEPIYEKRSMIDRWMEGAEFLEEPEIEPIEEPTEEPTEEREEMQCHPVGWTKKNHYSELGWQWCGQSCPCCRAHAGDTLGACPVCIRERE
tara:strand:+ start:289 stop:891 length:603 start_codon:yes stop_codon:yes gene_type:complete